MIEIACLIVVGVVTWMVASEGVTSAAQTFLCTLAAALIAMNFFEPLAIQLKAFLPDMYCDFVALVGLFTALVFGFRMGAEYVAPRYVQVIPIADTIGRWVVGVGTGYLTMAFLLTALHTAPLPREFIGFKPERNNVFGFAPDRQWLGFVQYISEKPMRSLVRYKIGSKDVFGPRPFDGRFEVIGDTQKPYSVRDRSGNDVPNLIWPSFPIRYAMRRDRYNMSQGSEPPPAPIILPPASKQPSGPPAAPNF